MTNDSQEILSYLQEKLPQYPFDDEIDHDFVEELIDDFHHLNILDETKAFRWYYDNQPQKRLTNVRLGLRRWMANAWTRKIYP